MEDDQVDEVDGTTAIIALLTRAVTGIMIGQIPPTYSNLQAAISVIDGIVCMDKSTVGDAARAQHDALETVKMYRAAIMEALALKTHQRHDFLIASYRDAVRVFVNDLGGAGMERMDPKKRDEIQANIDQIIGKSDIKGN